MWGQTHQFSYTLLYNSLNSGKFSGFDDCLINYRYQLLTSDNWVTSALRLSLILPTGNEDKGLGTGKLGFQFNSCFSKRITSNFTAHFNAGFTLIPEAIEITKNDNSTEKKLLSNYNIGASLIFLPIYNLNFMLEWVTNLNGSPDSKGDIMHLGQTIINPGLRFAIDIGELQIVPGLAMPITFSQGKTTSAIFLYLSFEHPF
jgi:hypothetical protein